MDTSDVKRDDKDDDLDKGMAAAKPEAKKDGDKKAAEPEPDFLMLSNPARVLPAQVSMCVYCICFDVSSLFFLLVCVMEGEGET